MCVSLACFFYIFFCVSSVDVVVVICAPQFLDSAFFVVCVSCAVSVHLPSSHSQSSPLLMVSTYFYCFLLLLLLLVVGFLSIVIVAAV